MDDDALAASWKRALGTPKRRHPSDEIAEQPDFPAACAKYREAIEFELSIVDDADGFFAHQHEFSRRVEGLYRAAMTEVERECAALRAAAVRELAARVAALPDPMAGEFAEAIETGDWSAIAF